MNLGDILTADEVREMTEGDSISFHRVSNIAGPAMPQPFYYGTLAASAGYRTNSIIALRLFRLAAKRDWLKRNWMAA